MSEKSAPLHKMSRAQLLEVLIEQSEEVGKVLQENEALKKELQEKAKTVEQLKTRLKKNNAKVKALKASLDAERMIRFQSLSDAKTISEASMYMNQILEDTRIANTLYQKLIHILAKEARKHE